MKCDLCGKDNINFWRGILVNDDDMQFVFNEKFLNYSQWLCKDCTKKFKAWYTLEKKK
jgi:hypothetical protein